MLSQLSGQQEEPLPAKQPPGLPCQGPRLCCCATVGLPGAVCLPSSRRRFEPSQSPAGGGGRVLTGRAGVDPVHTSVGCGRHHARSQGHSWARSPPSLPRGQALTRPQPPPRKGGQLPWQACSPPQRGCAPAQRRSWTGPTPPTPPPNPPSSLGLSFAASMPETANRGK